MNFSRGSQEKDLAPAPALLPFGGHVLEIFKESSGLGWDAPEDIHCDDAQIMSSLHKEFWDVILKLSGLNIEYVLISQPLV